MRSMLHSMNEVSNVMLMLFSICELEIDIHVYICVCCIYIQTCIYIYIYIYAKNGFTYVIAALICNDIYIYM